MTRMSKRLLLLGALLAGGSAGLAAESRTVRFKTDDGWTICGRYQEPRKGRPVAVLVHGAAASKEEWGKLQAELGRRGIGSLAIDLRGHAGSRQGPAGRADFQGFDAAEEWPRAQEDLEAAAAFLKKRGIPESRIAYLGASIGANLVSWAKPRPLWLALLSAGIEYRGVRLAPRPEGLPVLVAASPGDAYAWRTSAAYASEYPGAVFLRARHGHGAQMLADPEFLRKLLDWIESNSQKPPARTAE